MVRDAPRAKILPGSNPTGAALLTMRVEHRGRRYRLSMSRVLMKRIGRRARRYALQQRRERVHATQPAAIAFSLAMHELHTLTLRSPPQAGVSKGEATGGASWFETRRARRSCPAATRPARRSSP
ncbi:hypothetical protein BRAS3809_260001 [Bradyrhizobium sp. STM 3809]|nr:hypothetical protein BRAS3809_260001 [Bradyrhizobium sp. STM 3809]